jgi:hypothetical protein
MSVGRVVSSFFGVMLMLWSIGTGFHRTTYLVPVSRGASNGASDDSRADGRAGAVDTAEMLRLAEQAERERAAQRAAGVTFEPGKPMVDVSERRYYR